MEKAVITVVGKDKVGIIAAVCNYLAKVNINILDIDGFEVNLSGQYPAMLVIHRDVPGVINKVTWALSRFEINIAFMRLSRKSRGEEALMLLETDENVPEEVVEECKQVHNVSDVFTVPSI